MPDSGAAKPGTTWPSVGWPGVTESWTSPGSLTPFTVVKLPPTYTVLSGPAITVYTGPWSSTGAKFGSTVPVPS